VLACRNRIADLECNIFSKKIAIVPLLCPRYYILSATKIISSLISSTVIRKLSICIHVQHLTFDTTALRKKRDVANLNHILS
jgi:hypothetical protein